MAINNKDLREVGAHVVSAADELAQVLNSTTSLDWEQPTPDLAWTQTQTAIHTMRACLEYSYQVVGKKLDTYQPVLFERKEAATPSDYLLMIPTAARVLSKVVATASPEDRAWHAYGESDPIGFAAMGVVEVSVHTYDLAKGFGLDFTPLEAPSEFAINRLFFDTVETSEAFNDESWGKKLLWYAGRIELAGMARREGWKWNGRVR
jgi:Mycothiol maleylpyruvate isomerase N-terminal domain